MENLATAIAVEAAYQMDAKRPRREVYATLHAAICEVVRLRTILQEMHIRMMLQQGNFTTQEPYTP